MNRKPAFLHVYCYLFCKHFWCYLPIPHFIEKLPLFRGKNHVFYMHIVILGAWSYLTCSYIRQRLMQLNQPKSLMILREMGFLLPDLNRSFPCTSIPLTW